MATHQYHATEKGSRNTNRFKSCPDYKKVKLTHMKYFYRVMSYISIFTLGLYASSEFRFNTSIELHRWVITSFFFLFFLLLSSKDNKPQS